MKDARAVSLVVGLSVSLGLVAGCEKASPAASLPSAPRTASPASVISSTGGTAASAASCGNPGQPRCPLQAWMQATLQAYLVRDDVSNLPRIAAALEKLANFGPLEYPNWTSQARRGAEAARRHDFPALKEACAACHDAYRPAFRAQMRERRLF